MSTDTMPTAKRSNVMQPLSRLRHSRQVGRAAGRRAFSLIELMVVIVIIGVLMSLLLVGVRGAMVTARNATVVVEFQQIDKAMVDFKSKYGTEPPSRILLCEDGLDWTTLSGTLPTGFVAADVPRSRALLRQIWPDFSFDATTDYDINDDGDTTDLIGLTGSECLVFFLGGVPDYTGATDAPWKPLGFSANPQFPLLRTGARVGPFFEFQVSRLMNVEGSTDTERMPEYRDGLPGQRNPILFATSYGGKGYRDADIRLTAQPTYDAYATLPTGFAYVYRRYSGAYPATVPNFTAAEAFNPKTYQLVSPGADGEYGWGGVLNTAMEMVEPRAERYFERDNITNFKGGTIN